jgi:ATP-dependent DNA helicase RecG
MGSVTVDALDDAEYSGNLIMLLQNGLDFIRNNYKVKWRKTAERRVEMPEYPQTAIREALINAIIHRDHSFMGSEIHIDMYDDRLEITSPGGMTNGKRIQDMDISSVPSARRNPVIADLFQRLDLAERRGSGIKKIRKEYENSDRQPVFFSNESWFTTTLYNLSYGIDYEMANGADPGNEVGDDGNKFGNGGNDNWDKIRNAITQNPRIKLDGICVETGISKRTVSRELKKMQEFGNVRRVGSARSGHWKIIDKP